MNQTRTFADVEEDEDELEENELVLVYYTMRSCNYCTYRTLCKFSYCRQVEPRGSFTCALAIYSNISHG